MYKYSTFLFTLLLLGRTAISCHPITFCCFWRNVEVKKHYLKKKRFLLNNKNLVVFYESATFVTCVYMILDVSQMITDILGNHFPCA